MGNGSQIPYGTVSSDLFVNDVCCELRAATMFTARFRHQLLTSRLPKSQTLYTMLEPVIDVRAKRRGGLPLALLGRRVTPCAQLSFTHVFQP